MVIDSLLGEFGQYENVQYACAIVFYKICVNSVCFRDYGNTYP